MESGWINRFRDRYNFLKINEGLTQKTLADQIGVSQPTVGHWLKGKTEPDSIDLYIRLSKAIKLHPAKLLFDRDTVPNHLQTLVISLTQLDQESIELIEQLVVRFKGNRTEIDKREKSDRRQGHRRNP